MRSGYWPRRGALRIEAPTSTEKLLKTNSMAVSILTAVALSLFSATRLQADDAAAIGERIRAAKKGMVVQLPAGTFKIGNLVLGDGVSLIGAGCSKTTLDATGNDFGITVAGHAAVKPGDPGLDATARLSDLAVVEASQGGVVLDGASGVTVQRVSVRHCGSGLIARGASNCALGNLILGDCRAGANLLRCQRTSLVNATVPPLDKRIVLNA